MNADARAVANFLLDYAEEKQRPISHFSIQKIVYFCHGWHLAMRGEPLIGELAQAWDHGPVFRSVYRSFKQHGRNPITTRAKTMNYVTGTEETVTASFDDETSELLRNVFDVYARYRPATLRKLTHLPDGPWDQIRKKAADRPLPGMKIPNDLIKSYFITHPLGLARQ